MKDTLELRKKNSNRVDDFFTGRIPRESRCPAGRGRIYITPSGGIYPLNLNNRKCYGNIFTHNLPDVIRQVRPGPLQNRRHCAASDISPGTLKTMGIEYDFCDETETWFNLYKHFGSARRKNVYEKTIQKV